MFSESDPNSAIWTITSWVILFGLIPIVLYLLGKASSAGTTPDKEQMKEVRRLSVEISQGAETILAEGSRAFMGAAGERFALDVLIRFADSADQFRMLVLDLTHSPNKARNAFRELAIEFERALAAYPALKAYRGCEARMEKQRRLIDELKHLYDAQPLQSGVMTSQGAGRKRQSVLTQSSNDLDPPLS